MLIFVRHAEKDEAVDRKDPPLTARGREMARATGRWLVEQSHVPARIVTTRTRRTRETAALIVEVLAVAGYHPEVVARAGGPTTVERWDELAAFAGEGAAFVGHHPTQGLLVRAFGAPLVPAANKCAAFVMERHEGGWRCRAHWPGTPSGTG